MHSYRQSLALVHLAPVSSFTSHGPSYITLVETRSTGGDRPPSFGARLCARKLGFPSARHQGRRLASGWVGALAAGISASGCFRTTSLHVGGRVGRPHGRRPAGQPSNGRHALARPQSWRSCPLDGSVARSLSFLLVILLVEPFCASVPLVRCLFCCESRGAIHIYVRPRLLVSDSPLPPVAGAECCTRKHPSLLGGASRKAAPPRTPSLPRMRILFHHQRIMGFAHCVIRKSRL